MADITPLEFYLVVLQPKIVFTGQVSNPPGDPYMSIQWSDGATGTIGAPLPANTVWFGTAAGLADRGKLRLRSWTPGDATGTAGTMSVAESDDVGPTIEVNDHITIKQEWRLWDIKPRVEGITDTELISWEDYDIAHTDQTDLWEPIAVAGVPGVGWLEGGQAQISFVGDRSFALGHGASLSSYLWTAEGSVEKTSSSQGTEGSPVVFTWTGTASGQYDGQYHVGFEVTDSNGKTHTNHTWGFVIDPNDPDVTVYDGSRFSPPQDSVDWGQGGAEASFAVHGGADISDFPEGALVLLVCRGTLTTPTGTWPYRSEVLFWGYISAGTIRQDPTDGDVTFRAATVDALMRNLSQFPASLRDVKGPKDWTQAKRLTVDRASSFLWRYRSTLSLMAPIRPSNYSPLIARQDFAPTNLYANLEALLSNCWGHVWCDSQGVVYHGLNYQTMLDSEQASVSTRKTLHKGIWVGSLEIEEVAMYAQQVNQVKQNGILYPGDEGKPLPLFSEAPGGAMKPFGREDAKEGFILNSQDDLNTRCGRRLAEMNQTYPVVRGKFLNDGSFSVGPQEIFPAIIEPTDNDRGLSWTPDLIPRRINRSYDHGLGYFSVEVEFVPSTTGPAGVTVTMPVDPPTPELPPWDPPPDTPWPDIIDPQAGLAAAADSLMGHYMTFDRGETWQARNNNLPSTQTRDLIWDPWWKVKTGDAGPESVILVCCGVGFIAVSENAGWDWRDVTINITSIPNSWEDSPAPEPTDLTYIQVHADIHNQDRLYALGEWQNDSAEWRGWLLRSNDFGMTWTAVALVAAGGDNIFGDGAFANTGCTLHGNFSDMDNVANSTAWGVDTNGAATFVEVTPPDPIVAGQTINVRGQKTGGITGYLSIREWDGGAWVQNPTMAVNPAVWGWTYPVAQHSHTSIRLQRRIGDFFNCDWELDCMYIAASGLLPDARPLWMDLDTEDGTRLYVTVARGTTLQLQRRNTVAVAMTTTATASFGTAVAAEVAAKIYHIVPRCPHRPGVAGFGDYVFIFGRWDEAGTARHFSYNTAADLSGFATMGDAGWTTERVGGAEIATDGLTIQAVLNSGAPGLWQTGDGGTTWALISAAPFNIEADAISKHWGSEAYLLIGNNTGSTQMAAYIGLPYTGAWTDATGPPGARLPTAADGGGGLYSIVWF